LFLLWTYRQECLLFFHEFNGDKNKRKRRRAMKTNTIKKILSALVIMVLIGWGPGALAGDAYSAGEHGIPNPWVFSGSDDGISSPSRGTRITGEGYCFTSSSGSAMENSNVYSEGERGIANPLALSAKIGKPDVSETSATSDTTKLCLRTGSDKPLSNDGFNYSLGRVGETH
jgi:hypothetical protein